MINLTSDFFFVGGVVRNFLLANCNSDITPIKASCPCKANHNIAAYNINYKLFLEFAYTHNDIDIATTLTPQSAHKYLAEKGYNPTKVMGTNSFTRNGINFDITSTRIDYDHDGRYAKMKFGTSICSDSLRRDFTINAFYISQDSILYDFHNGMEDIKSRSIRFIGDPNKRISEDYLRIARCLRFAYLYDLKIEQNTIAACLKNIAHVANIPLKKLNAEIIKMEN